MQISQFRREYCLRRVYLCPRGALPGHVHETEAVQHGDVPPPQHNLQQCFLDFQPVKVFTRKYRPRTSKSELNDNNYAFPSDIPWNSIEANCGNLLFLHPETLCTTAWKPLAQTDVYRQETSNKTRAPVVEWGQWTMQKCREKNWKGSLAGNWQWERSGRRLRKILFR